MLSEPELGFSPELPSPSEPEFGFSPELPSPSEPVFGFSPVLLPSPESDAFPLSLFFSVNNDKNFVPSYFSFSVKLDSALIFTSPSSAEVEILESFMLTFDSVDAPKPYINAELESIVAVLISKFASAFDVISTESTAIISVFVIFMLDTAFAPSKKS